MAACHSRCQVVSLDCSQSVTGRKERHIFILLERKTRLVPSRAQKRIFSRFISDLCTGGGEHAFFFLLWCPNEYFMVICFCSCDAHVGSRNLLLAEKWIFLCAFSVSSLWFCCIGFSVCNFTRLMTLSHTCEASLTKIQRHNVHSIFVSFFPVQTAFQSALGHLESLLVLATAQRRCQC